MSWLILLFAAKTSSAIAKCFASINTKTIQPPIKRQVTAWCLCPKLFLYSLWYFVLPGTIPHRHRQLVIHKTVLIRFLNLVSYDFSTGQMQFNPDITSHSENVIAYNGKIINEKSSLLKWTKCVKYDLMAIVQKLCRLAIASSQLWCPAGLVRQVLGYIWQLVSVGKQKTPRNSHGLQKNKGKKYIWIY